MSEWYHSIGWSKEYRIDGEIEERLEDSKTKLDKSHPEGCTADTSFVPLVMDKKLVG